MKRLGFCLSLWLASSAVYAIDNEVAFEDPVLNARYIALVREIRCPKCLNESIADSDAPVAADLRREVRRLMGDGATDEDVKNFLAARYGEFVLYRPRVTPTTWALWAGPFVLLLIGSLVFWRVLKARGAQPLGEDATT
jgi:cytochrome c-type biogenesis protein CcmH